MTTGLMRWTPETDLFRTRMDRVFNEMLRDWGAPVSESVAGRTWAPAVDIKESDEALTLTAELPGFDKNQVEITLENNVLTLAGERKFEQESKGEAWHRIERSYGSFSRSFTLPATVKTDKVDAKFENGLLAISLPKVEESKPRKIAIR
jgi:HSP20 family protein